LKAGVNVLNGGNIGTDIYDNGDPWRITVAGQLTAQVKIQLINSYVGGGDGFKISPVFVSLNNIR